MSATILRWWRGPGSREAAAGKAAAEPDPEVAARIAELREYLRQEFPDRPELAGFCFDWIAACAALPVLRWPITAVIGKRLALRRGIRVDESLHLAIGRVAWFRLGEIQRAIRAPLLLTVPDEDWPVLRDTVAGILDTATRTSEAALRKGEPVRLRPASPAFLKTTMPALIEDASPGTLASDPILTLLLRGQRPTPGRLRWARWLSRQPPLLRWALGPKPLATLAILLVFVAGVQVWAFPALKEMMAKDGQIKTNRRVAEVSIGHCAIPGIDRLQPGAASTLPAAQLPIETIAPLHAEFEEDPIGFDLSTKMPKTARIVTGSDDKTARVWDAASGRLLATLEGHKDTVRSAAFSPDGARIVTGSGDKTARVWDAASGRLLATLEGHKDTVRSAAFSPDGARIVTGSGDKTARVWDAASGRLLATLEGHKERVGSAAFSPDGARLVTASDDETARVWDAASGRLLATLEGHKDTVRSAAFSPDGARIVTGSDDKTARVWDAASGRLLATLEGHTGWVISAAFSPDGARIVTGSDDKTARVWDAASGRVLATLEGHTGWVISAAFSPDGAHIVTGNGDNTARVWDAASGRLLATLEGHTDWVRSAAFSPDGARLVTASDDETARVWDAASGRLLATLEGHTDWVGSAAFSPDGARIVTGNGDKTARVWDAASGRLLATLEGHTGWVISAAFSPDGARIVTGNGDKTARVWDAASGRLLATLEGHTDWVRSAAFSPDGARLVTASDDETARVWDAASGRLLATLEGHKDTVRSAAFSPDGARIVTGSDDKTARVWDAASGRLLATLEGHTGSMISAAFSPDGGYVVATDRETIWIWEEKVGWQGTQLRERRHDEITGGVGWARNGTPIIVSCEEWGLESAAVIAATRQALYEIEQASTSNPGRPQGNQPLVGVFDRNHSGVISALLAIPNVPLAAELNALSLLALDRSFSVRRDAMAAEQAVTARIDEAGRQRILADLLDRTHDPNADPLLVRAAMGALPILEHASLSSIVQQTARPEPEVPVSPAPAVPVSRTFLIFFDWAKSDLTERSRQIVSEAAKSVSHLTGVRRVNINGYDDTSGSPRVSQELSIRRAQAVAVELVKDGIAKDLLAIQGFGQTHLLVPTNSGVREPQNRRVEIIIEGGTVTDSATPSAQR